MAGRTAKGLDSRNYPTDSGQATKVAERGESPSLNKSISYSSVENNMKEIIRIALVFLAAIYFGKAAYCTVQIIREIWREKRKCQ